MDTQELYMDESAVEQLQADPDLPPSGEQDLEPAAEQENLPETEPEVLTPQEAQAELDPDKEEEDPEKINAKALYIGAVLLVIICAFFAIMKSISQGAPFFEYPAMIFAVMAGVAIYMFHKRENIGFLFGGIALIAGTLCLTLLYYLNR